MHQEEREADIPETRAGRSSATGREIPGLRSLRTLLRTLHIAAFGALYGGHVYAVAPERLTGALAATLVTGAALVTLEVWQNRLWLIQVRGLATLAKIALTGVVALSTPPSVGLLTAILTIGAVSSHMPSRWRYYSLFHGRVIGPRTRG